MLYYAVNEFLYKINTCMIQQRHNHLSKHVALAVHYGYSLAVEHHLYTSYCGALWDLISALKNVTMGLDANNGCPFKCPI